MFGNSFGRLKTNPLRCFCFLSPPSFRSSPSPGSWLGVFVLLLTALVWGSAFLPQKMAMSAVDPLFFTSVRFACGWLTLLPFVFACRNPRRKESESDSRPFASASRLTGPGAGFLLAAGACLQQWGLIYTSIANAGFITAFYIILVPLFYALLGRKIAGEVSLAGLTAMAGIYLLSVGQDFSLRSGDLMVLLSAVFWALHIMFIEKFGAREGTFSFAAKQFFYCASFSLLFAVLMGEDLDWGILPQLQFEIFYTGVVSAGVGFTLQVFGQRMVRAEFAALIFTMESVFGAFFEGIFLGVWPNAKGMTGCLLVFVAVLFSQKRGFALLLDHWIPRERP